MRRRSGGTLKTRSGGVEQRGAADWRGEATCTCRRSTERIEVAQARESAADSLPIDPKSEQLIGVLWGYMVERREGRGVGLGGGLRVNVGLDWRSMVTPGNGLPYDPREVRVLIREYAMYPVW